MGAMVVMLFSFSACVCVRFESIELKIVSIGIKKGPARETGEAKRGWSDWAYLWDGERHPFERGKAIVTPNGVGADDFVSVAVVVALGHNRKIT